MIVLMTCLDVVMIVAEYVEGTPLDVLMKEHPEKQNEYLNFFYE